MSVKLLLHRPHLCSDCSDALTVAGNVKEKISLGSSNGFPALLQQSPSVNTQELIDVKIS